MRIAAYGASDLGLRRPINEDSFRLCPGIQLYLVADGMGGHAAGDVASLMAVNEVAEYVEQALIGEYSKNAGPPDYETVLRKAVQEANKKIIHATHNRKDLRGMGTTVVAVLIRGNRLFAGSVGDSRIYLVRESEIRLLTTDHSWVNMQVRLGNMTSEESKLHPMRNVITRALGTQRDVEVDTFIDVLQDNDHIVMCTDGLSNMLRDEEIARITLDNDTDLKQSVEDLIQKANSRGGDDNITAVVLRSYLDASMPDHYSQDTEVMFIRPIKPHKPEMDKE
ncbi:Stp1/IreP family PP2C-type Ser/Thr phosphatase [bacterium]|nr:Stp1/IreP family PP2C-type Ser/Thr phosphatase [candidate division CSSED10-310 bacterium]